MTIRDQQKMIATWARETFPGQTLESIQSHLREEVAELKLKQVKKLDVSEEVADCLILCMAAAQHFAQDNFSVLLFWLTAGDVTDDPEELVGTLEFHLDFFKEPRHIGDLFQDLLGLCLCYGLKPLEIVNRKHEINLKRKFVFKPELGYHKHEVV